MGTRVVVWAFAVLLLASAQANAQFYAPAPPPPGEDFHVELGLMFWTPKPELTLSTDSLAAVGVNDVDFVKEFGFPDTRFREFRFTSKAGRKHKLRFSSVEFHYNEDAALPQTITFNGYTFPVSLAANADLKWDLRRFGYEYDFATGSHGLFGLITELKYNKVTGTVTAPAIGTATAEHTAPIPTIGLIGRGYVQKYISITGEFTGLKIPASWSKSFNGKFYDLDLYATASITKYLGVQGGYRAITTDYLVDTGHGDLKMKGPYFGGLIRF